MAGEDLLVSQRDLHFAERRRWVGLVGAPVLLVAIIALHPVNMNPQAARLLAVLAATLLLWITEALPVAVTALLGPAVAVALGVAPADKMFASFGNPMLFLLYGAFVLAAAAERTRLDRLLAARLFPDEGSSPERTLVVSGLVTAGISSLFSNAATTAMMVPVVRAAVAKLSPRAQAVGMLSAAFSSSIGGVLMPVGTPPNLLAMAALAQYAKQSLPFFHWTLLALPMATACMAVWMTLMVVTVRRERQMATLVAGPPVADVGLAADLLSVQQGQGLLGLNQGQAWTLLAIVAAAAGWVLPGLVELVCPPDDPVAAAIKAALPEGVVAILASALLFAVPAAPRNVAGRLRKRPVLTWAEAAQIDWGTILLFGGGLALGDQVFKTGLSTFIGDAIVHTTGVHSLWGLTILFSTASLLLSELTSNTATAAMMCPLAVMTANQLGLSPLEPVVASGLAASMGFLMPISTAPNAIVYGTGKVPLGVMVRYGLWLDATALLVIPPTVIAVAGILRAG